MDANVTGASWISHMGIDREMVYALFQYTTYIPVHKHIRKTIKSGTLLCWSGSLPERRGCSVFTNAVPVDIAFFG